MMNNEQILRQVKKIREDYEQQWKAVDRKRSWRSSERAMAKADYGMKLEALDRVITMLLNIQAEMAS